MTLHNVAVNKKSHTLHKIVKCVFGADRRRVSAYSIVLRTANVNKIKSADIADFIRNNGGVEEIRLAKNGNALSAKQKAEVAKNIEYFGCPTCVELVEGNVEKTIKNVKMDKISFAFLDVDLVDSYKACFAGLAGKIEPESVVVIHEACYRQIRELVLEKNNWTEIGLDPPRVVFISEKFKLRSCRNLAFLFWNNLAIV
jgi:hypothetical protein